MNKQGLKWTDYTWNVGGGFKHHYWHPERLKEPLKLKVPAKIFLDDLMGHWVPDEQIEAVLDICRRAHWHTFQLLSKNAPRLQQFEFPPNVWVGISAPPSRMMGKPLTPTQQYRWFGAAQDSLNKCNAALKWISFEPMSFDIARICKMDHDFKWAVIGAASKGKTVYQPDPAWVALLVDRLTLYGKAVFFKGNLRGNPAAEPWREEFPIINEITQLKLLED